MFEGIKDMGKLLKQAKEMKSKMKSVQNELKKMTVTGLSKKRKAKVILTGELECVEITFDPELNTRENCKALAKELKEAFNDAAVQAKGLATNKLSDISKGMDIPGLT